MKLGCSTLHYEVAGVSQVEAIKSLSSIGYKGVELTYGRRYFTEEPTNFPNVKDLKNVLENTGTEMVSFSTSLFWAYRGNKVKYNKIVLEKLANAAAELKGDHIVVVTGAWPDDLDREEAWDNMVENMTWAADLATKRGLKIAIEVVVSWGVRNTETFLKMRQQVGDKIYVNIDPSNFGLSGEDCEAVIKNLKDYIGGIHLKDSRYKGFTDEEINSWMKTKTFESPVRPGWTPTGEGDVNFKNFLKTLKEIDYKDWCMFEYEGNLNGYYTDPVKASSDSYAYFDKILKEINS